MLNYGMKRRRAWILFEFEIVRRESSFFVCQLRVVAWTRNFCVEISFVALVWRAAENYSSVIILLTNRFKYKDFGDGRRNVLLSVSFVCFVERSVSRCRASNIIYREAFRFWKRNCHLSPSAENLKRFIHSKKASCDFSRDSCASYLTHHLLHSTLIVMTQHITTFSHQTSNR